MKIKNSFLQGKMNKDVDERLLPQGQYRHAENIDVANTGGSDAGAIENVRGNKRLSTYVSDIFANNEATTIGTHTDSSNHKIYWFVKAYNVDLIIEYNVKTSTHAVLLETYRSMTIPSLLNFRTEYPITGVSKLINGDPSKDLLLWTDDFNPPRMINIERAKADHILGTNYTEDDISLIKKPPRYAPVTIPIEVADASDDNLKDRFISFATRYKYLDGGFSALSSFTNYTFTPKPFDLDYQTMENNGMVNAFNSVNISFDTGSKRVTDVELVFKESNSNTVYVIEGFNKEDEEWVDNTIQNFTFSNDKSYAALAEDELFRTYDNVPKLAKALELIGNRVVLGNYTEGYDLVDKNDTKVNLDYVVSSEHTLPEQVEITSFSPQTPLGDKKETIGIDFTGVDLTIDRVITLDVSASFNESAYNPFPTPPTLKVGTLEYIYRFVLPATYTDITALLLPTDATSFRYFVETTMTTLFMANRNESIAGNPAYVSNTNFVLIASTVANSIEIQAPIVTFAGSFVAEYTWDATTKALTTGDGSSQSLKSNRSYEVGMKYMDEYGRASTVLTSKNNTHFIGPEYSATQNALIVEVDHNPPVWADRYKFVIKENKGVYETIYSNVVYRDGIHVWFLLQGTNKNKVKDGDELILKASTTRVYDEVKRLRVLSVETKEENFITGNTGTSGVEISELAGLYFKVRLQDFSVNPDNNLTYLADGGNRSIKRENLPTVYLDLLTKTTQPVISNAEVTTAAVTDVALPVGSTITLKLNSNYTYRNGGYKEHKVEKKFTVLTAYANIKLWYDAEVTAGLTLLDDDGHDYVSNISIARGTSDVPIPTRTDYYAVSSLTSIPNTSMSILGGVAEVVHDPIVDGKLYMLATGFESGSDPTTGKNGYVDATITIQTSEEFYIFETEADSLDTNIYYETEQTFDIIETAGGNLIHKGNLQDQGFSPESKTRPAVISLDSFNCYTQGNGAESYRYKDLFNSKYLNIDLRPSSTSVEGYREVRRYADLTYSEVYNENNNLNGLNEFNLSRANYKEDIDKKYGYIQKLHSRDTDILVFQEDKVSKVLYGKDLLMNADGTSNITSIESVLGQQVAYAGEYGISRNPESFAYDGYNIYFTDAKRGAVMRLSNNGLTEISANGLKQFYKDLFKDSIDDRKLGAFDPYLDQYVLNIKDNEDYYTVTYDEKVQGWTSFHSYTPDNMVGMNNKFFSFKEGDLYIHHDETAIRNTFYGVTYPSKVSVIVNENPSEVKGLQSISLEGSHPWDIDITAYISTVSDFKLSSIAEGEFVKKEGLWYAYTRRDESPTQQDSKAIYGIGKIESAIGDVVVINGFNSLLNVGDVMVGVNNLTQVDRVITSVIYDPSNKKTALQLSNITNLTVGEFVMGRKDARIEGGVLRGYTMRLDLEKASSDKVELFAVNSEVIKSYT